jgi:hypothetical protein
MKMRFEAKNNKDTTPYWHKVIMADPAKNLKVLAKLASIPHVVLLFCCCCDAAMMLL